MFRWITYTPKRCAKALARYTLLPPGCTASSFETIYIYIRMIETFQQLGVSHDAFADIRQEPRGHMPPCFLFRFTPPPKKHVLHVNKHAHRTAATTPPAPRPARLSSSPLDSVGGAMPIPIQTNTRFGAPQARTTHPFSSSRLERKTKRSQPKRL